MPTDMLSTYFPIFVHVKPSVCLINALGPIYLVELLGSPDEGGSLGGFLEFYSSNVRAARSNPTQYVLYRSFYRASDGSVQCVNLPQYCSSLASRFIKKPCISFKGYDAGSGYGKNRGIAKG